MRGAISHLNIDWRKHLPAFMFYISVILTPFAVTHAYNYRGYWAFGGEVLLMPMGWLIGKVIKCRKK